VQEPSFAEAAHSPAIAVSTLEEKPADLPTPFSGDAWAAAMAAGVEEKLAQASEAPEATKEPQSSAEMTAVVQDTVVQESAREQAMHAEEPAKVSETSNAWYSISSSPWDAEAKKASHLAATWDMPASQLVPAEVEQADSPLEDKVVPAEQVESHYEGVQTESYVEHHDSAYGGHKEEAQVETFAGTHEDAKADTLEQAPAAEPPASTVVWQTAETPVAETLLAGTVPLAAPKGWENTWEAGGPLPAEQFAEVAQEQALQVADGYLASTQEQRFVAEETPVEWTPIAETGVGTVVAGARPEAAKPDMDALVARVLEKMNPELLQKMTHEFLRPVIEAIIQDELSSKKS
jgi:hypothetical protein